MNTKKNTKKQIKEYPLVNEGYYLSDHIANFFLHKASQNNKKLDVLKLVKLCYLGYGWVLSILSKRLIVEHVEAWQFGPVIPSVYYSFKYFERSPITSFTPTMQFNRGSGRTNIKYFSIKPGTEESKILAIVWNSYKDLSGKDMIKKMHTQDGPWIKYYEPGIRGIVMDDHVIKEHFDRIISQRLKEADSNEK